MSFVTLPRMVGVRAPVVPLLGPPSHRRSPRATIHSSARVHAKACYVWGSANELFSDVSGHRTERLAPRVFAPPPHAQTPIQALSFGQHHYGLVTEDGKLYMGGRGEYNELGLGKPLKRVDTPRLVTDIPPITDVSVGVYHSIALTVSGEVLSCGWGGNFFTPGALGHGDKQARERFTPIAGLKGEKIVQIASGKDHVLCLNDKGEVFAFGRGEFGRLGTGGSGNELAPVKLDALADTKVVKIAAGSSFSAAVTDTGSLYSWGRNDAGQLGQGIGLMISEMSMESAPQRVEFDFESVDGVEENVNVTDVACGHRHMLAMTAEGRVWLFGMRQWMKPVLIRGDDEVFLREKVTAITAGKNMSAVVTNDGRVWTWGNGRSAQLGHGNKTAYREPTPVQYFGRGREGGRAVRLHAGGCDQIAVFAE